jgi:glycosyltransferase involved in cell wall biosynthesis
VKVSVIFHRFGPYHVARLEAAAQRCQIIGIELGSETAEYAWAKISEGHSFKRLALFPEGDSRAQMVAELDKRMRDVLAQERPDVVAIPGWSEKGALVALRWCLDNAVPAMLMSETTAADEGRVWRKEFVKRRIVRRCSSALVGGMRHRDYLVALGMAPERIFTGYDAVDNRYFEEGAMEVRSRNSEVRRKHDLPKDYFLASARFIPKKNLDGLIRAYAAYRAQTSDLRLPTSDPWSLVILGNGPLESGLRSLIADLSLQDSVLLPGFKQYDELPAYYGLANAFVHASRVEQWGLVVNEAMASGLPVIVSDRCGCVPDLVREGKNGYTFNPHDLAALTERMLQMSSLEQLERVRFADESRRIVGEFGPARFADGLEQAAEIAMAAPRPTAAAIDRLVLNAMLKR